jgi:hypothetical protein
VTIARAAAGQGGPSSLDKSEALAQLGEPANSLILQANIDNRVRLVSFWGCKMSFVSAAGEWLRFRSFRGRGMALFLDFSDLPNGFVPSIFDLRQIGFVSYFPLAGRPRRS